MQSMDLCFHGHSHWAIFQREHGKTYFVACINDKQKHAKLVLTLLHMKGKLP